MATTQRGALVARWCFTYNNPPTPWDPPTGSEVKYMIWQRERGTEAGTEHVQGYVRFAGRKAMTAVKRWFSVDTIHVEPANGTEEQNKMYCSKAEGRLTEPQEYGVYEGAAGKQGKRTDLDAIADALQQGSSIKDVAIAHPGDYMRYHQGIEKFKVLMTPLPPLERAIQLTVLYGATNTGKTHRARMTYPEIYEVNPGRDPWGKYTGQAQILFDEFDDSKWTIQDMNRYCDKWRCPLDCRYINRYAEWTLVVICANSDPMSWWPNSPQPLRTAFWRRMTQVQEVHNKEQDIDLNATTVVYSP